MRKLKHVRHAREIRVAGAADGEHRQSHRHPDHNQREHRHKADDAYGERTQGELRSSRVIVMKAAADSSTSKAALASINQPIGMPRTVEIV